jgi:hypothetical protein
MRFMTFYRPGKEATGAPSQEMMAAMGKLIGEWAQAGVLVSTEGLLPSSHGARVRIDGGNFTVANGPIDDPKGLIGGYAIINAKSKDEAVELTKAFLRVVGEGESEIRQMHEGSPKPP